MVEVKQLHEVPIRNTVVAVLLSLLAFLSAGFTTPDLNDFTSGAESLDLVTIEEHLWTLIKQ